MISLSLGPMFREAGGGGGRAKRGGRAVEEEPGVLAQCREGLGKELVGERKRVICLQERSG